MPQLDFVNYPFISQLFWLFLSFLILYIFVAKLILPQIAKILSIRKAVIDDVLNEASKIRAEAEEFMNKGSDDLLQANEQAKKIIANAQEQIAEHSRLETIKLEEKLEAKIKKTEEELKQFKKENSKKIEKLSSEIYNNLVKKIVK